MSLPIITALELSHVQLCDYCRGHFIYDGRPYSALTWEIERLRRRYGVKSGSGLDMETGQFVVAPKYKPDPRVAHLTHGPYKV